MDSLLDALQEGRLIELPDNDKQDSLQLLSHIIEAIPSVPSGTDVAGLVLKREETYNTALGKGFAVPHARGSFDGDLYCSVGWSPSGISYGSPDGNIVHIVIMYLVPDNQRNSYLKEVSNIAKALNELHDEQSLKSAVDLNTVRNYLLDLVTSAKSIVGPEARARMIQLEARENLPQAELHNIANLLIEPITIITASNFKPITLAQNKELIDLLEGSPNLVESLNSNGKFFDYSGWRILKHSSSIYQAGRTAHECIAIKLK
ncbi:MAG: PTS sugar transporter subunit IIA [Ignavibacteriaceae bacterium]|nr:PTS sugar transporter subunit IIA [Ignavibacteriaceae bacterium]